MRITEAALVTYTLKDLRDSDEGNVPLLQHLV